MGMNIIAKWMLLAKSRVMIVRNPDSQKLSGTIHNVSMKWAWVLSKIRAAIKVLVLFKFADIVLVAPQLS